jgi:hypothetical protein
MKHKTKNSPNAHTLDDNSPTIDGPNGPISYKPDYILPKGMVAFCHGHSKILFFKTLEDLHKHDREYHDYRKIRSL